MSNRVVLAQARLQQYHCWSRFYLVDKVGMDKVPDQMEGINQERENKDEK